MKRMIFAAVILLGSSIAAAQYIGPAGVKADRNRTAPVNHPVMPADHPLMTGSSGTAQAAGNHPVLPANHPLLTVAALQQQGRDDMRVTLEGHIIRHERGEHYVFSDGTGELSLDIDDKYFPAGRPIDATTKVRVSGKLDVDQGEPMELDVKYNIEILP